MGNKKATVMTSVIKYYEGISSLALLHTQKSLYIQSLRSLEGGKPEIVSRFSVICAKTAIEIPVPNVPMLKTSWP